MMMKTILASMMTLRSLASDCCAYGLKYHEDWPEEYILCRKGSDGRCSHPHMIRPNSALLLYHFDYPCTDNAVECPSYFPAGAQFDRWENARAEEEAKEAAAARKANSSKENPQEAKETAAARKANSSKENPQEGRRLV